MPLLFVGSLFYEGLGEKKQTDSGVLQNFGKAKSVCLYGHTCAHVFGIVFDHFLTCFLYHRCADHPSIIISMCVQGNDRVPTHVSRAISSTRSISFSISIHYVYVYML